VEDPDFDLSRHLHRVELGAPGGPRQLGELISDIASRQLDRRYPLWELWVVEGLDNGHVGFVAKIHHAAADGVAAAAMLVNVLEAEADPGPVVPPRQPWRSESPPPAIVRLVYALRDLFRALSHLPGLLRKTASGLAAVVRRRRSGALSPPLPLSTPRTSFNRALTPNRLFAMASLSLDDVKAVRRAFDVTVNDVVLALCAAALRRYLEERRELPERPLMAGVPVSVGAGQEGRLVGNKVSNLFTSLRTDIDDPVERLRAIHDVTQAAKEVQHALGPEMLVEWSEVTPPLLLTGFMRVYSRLRLADRHRPPINVVISNVPGPSEPLQIAGARLLEIYSMGPILEGIGLNITLWSYRDGLDVGAIACPDTLPDLRGVVDRLAPALAELLAAAEKGAAAGTAPRR
jgi:WS/DGAT/MGAT family acyltransferase